MSLSNFDLNFEQTQYYTLLEASDYLNKKHDSNSVTPQKLIKHMVKYDTSAYVHVRFENELFRVDGDFKTTLSRSPEILEFLKNPYKYSNKDESEQWLSAFKEEDRKINSRLYSYFYLGLILLGIDSSSLFNLSITSTQKNKPLLGFNGMLACDTLDGNPAVPSFINWDNDVNRVLGVGFFNIAIVNIDSVDIDDMKNNISLRFEKIYNTEGDKGFPDFKIDLDEIIVIDKDLQELEDKIIQNAPTVKREHSAIDRYGLPRKKGVSPKLLQARLVADAHAQHLWSKDHDKQIRVGEMYEYVWSYLVDTDYRDMLPENKESLRKWLSYIPDYASQPGKAPKNQ
ncbi:hypothetical protein PSAR109036_00675 [Psychrobacter arenosus]|uniref:hypothetical protein n=1 Tax=Psychrobacter arenosus TaxID=256326 RepID=UPI001919A1C2|nr:hypothetical protein [Psychrobacter arenosus]